MENQFNICWKNTIWRNGKLTGSQAQGICVQKQKNHSKKEIDISKTHLNYYLKKNELNYIKDFDRLKEESYNFISNFKNTKKNYQNK